MAPYIYTDIGNRKQTDTVKDNYREKKSNTHTYRILIDKEIQADIDIDRNIDDNR